MSMKAKILVIEDKPEDLQIANSLLSANGYEVIRAASPRDASEQLSRLDSDLVLIDVSMSGLDAFQVTRDLRQDDKTRFLPLIMITVEGRPEERIRGIDAGCDDFIVKPFDKEEVLTRIDTLLRTSQYRSLLNEKEKSGVLVKYAGEGVVICDPKLNVFHLNKTAEDYLGELPKVGKTPLLSLIQKNFRIHTSGDLEALLGKKSVAFDIERSETEELRPLILEVNSNPVRNPMGEICDIVLNLRNVTERRKKQFAERDFISLMHHKLMTPMTVIDGNLQLLDDGVIGPVTEDQARFIKKTMSKSRSLIDTFKKLMMLTSLQQEIPRKRVKPVVIKESLEGVLRCWSKSQDTKPLKFEIITEDETASVNMDPSHLNLIIDNLVQNAIKFNDKQSVSLKIYVNKLKSGHELCVQDNGSSIPGEEFEKVFDPFYQVDKHRTCNVEGAGIGLSIVKLIVDAYGGSIRIESKLAEGSNFRIMLPKGSPS